MFFWYARAGFSVIVPVAEVDVDAIEGRGAIEDWVAVMERGIPALLDELDAREERQREHAQQLEKIRQREQTRAER